MADAPPPPANRSRLAAWCSVAMVALAFAWLWPALGLGLRSDDYLLPYYTDRETGAVRWGRVLEEFVRPWFGADGLYRPLVSVGIGIELAAWPSLPARHAFNVACVGIAAAATAATAALLAPRRAVLAALVAGLTIVMHPAAVEPATWLCARTTGMQVAAGALAAWLFTRHRARGTRAWPGVAAFAAALLCKEGAVTVPVSLLVLDVLRDPDAPWRGRLRALLPYAVTLAGYFALRLAVLGRLGGGTGGGAALDGLANVATRATHAIAPPPPPPPEAGALVGFPLAFEPLAIVCLAALAVAPLVPRLRARLLLLPAWLALLLAPTHTLPASEGFFGRLVLDAVPALALVLAAALAAANGRALLLTVAALQAGLVAGYAANSAAWLRQVVREDHTARAVERALHAAAAPATPARPFACTYLPRLPLFHDKLWGVLGLAPFAPRDLAVIGLAELLEPDPTAPQFRHDAAPVHAVLAAGGVVAPLQYETLSFRALPAPPAGSVTLARAAAAPRQLVADQRWPGTAFAAFELNLPAPARRVRWRLLDDLPEPRAHGWQELTGRAGTTWVDTTHALPPVLLQGVGAPFRGIELEVDGGDPPRGSAVRVHARLDERPLPSPVAGAPRTREQLFALPQHPPAREPLRLYVMLPTGVRHQDVPAGGAPIDGALRAHLDYALDLYAPLVVHWFWQTPPLPADRPWRSVLDHAHAR